MIEKSNLAAKPVICTGYMLDSMAESDRPDRRRRSAYEEDPADPGTTFDGDPHSLSAAKLLRIIPRLRDPEGNPLFGEFASRLATARSLSDNNERSGKISKLMKQVRK